MGVSFIYLFILFYFLKYFVTPDRITIQILLNRLSKFGLDLYSVT